jgi:hypothetical protein
LLIPKGTNDDAPVQVVDVNWLKYYFYLFRDLFHPDNIKDGNSLKNIERLGGYSGL